MADLTPWAWINLGGDDESPWMLTTVMATAERPMLCPSKQYIPV
jgi:hypothetical protein